MILTTIAQPFFSFSQITVGDYTGIDHASDFTNPTEGAPCPDIALMNEAIGDDDYTSGAVDVPYGWSFSGTWDSGLTYIDGPGNELLLVSFHTWGERWNVALALSDGTTTPFIEYEVNEGLNMAAGTHIGCDGNWEVNIERPVREIDFADFTIPLDEGVVGVVFEPIADGTWSGDPHGVLVLEGTVAMSPCDDIIINPAIEFIVDDVSSVDGGTGGCFTSPVQFNDISAVTGLDMITTWSWDFGDGSSSTAENPIHTYETAGTYNVILTVTTENGCSAEFSINIEMVNCEPDDPVFANFEFDNNLCVGDCITLTDLSEGPVASYEWTFGGAADPDTSTEPSPTVCFTTVGTFTVSLTVTSESGLTSSVSTTLTVNEIPNITVYNDTIIDVGSEATLIVVAPSSGTFTWIPEGGLSCPECEVTQASPQNTTTYQVYYIDENGCSDQDSVKVWINYAQGIGVPSGFSPNGDGENDVLFVKGFGIEALNFSIFNRYGELVFQSDNQNLGWDGTFKNRDENPGVFVWVVNYTLQDGSYGTLKGNTTLIR